MILWDSRKAINRASTACVVTKLTNIGPNDKLTMTNARLNQSIRIVTTGRDMVKRGWLVIRMIVFRMLVST